MSANIVLDSRHTHYTNLDFLTGKVVLQLPTEAAIGGIQVKLECESRTRLSGPKNPQYAHSDKKRTELEVHKVGGYLGAYGEQQYSIGALANGYFRSYTKLLPSFPRRV
jgi:hypothetical protein